MPAVSSNKKLSWEGERIWFLEGSPYNVHITRFQQKKKSMNHARKQESVTHTQKRRQTIETVAEEVHTGGCLDPRSKYVQGAKGSYA